MASLPSSVAADVMVEINSATDFSPFPKSGVFSVNPSIFINCPSSLKYSIGEDNLIPNLFSI